MILVLGAVEELFHGDGDPDGRMAVAHQNVPDLRAPCPSWVGSQVSQSWTGHRNPSLTADMYFPSQL